MTSDATTETPRHTEPLAVATLAVLPFALLQLAFLTDPYRWSELLFGFGAIVVFGFGVFLAWVVYLGVETWWRRKYFPSNSIPSFALAGGVLLLAFFVPSMILRPVLQQMPAYCRATQAIRWDTSNGEFILVLIGTGTADDYRYSDGYMNWTGEGRAGFSSVHVNPIELQYDYHEPHHSGSIEVLRHRMAASGIPAPGLDTVAREVWAVLELANRGAEISSPSATVDAVSSDVDDMWDARIGGWVWLALLLLAFVAVGHFTIPRSTEVHSSAA